MANNKLEFFDKTFTLSKITAYSLSMEIDINHLAYTIIDNIRKKFVALVNKQFPQQLTEENFLDTIDQEIKNDQYLQKHYKEVNFIYPSNKFLLIPEKYFDKKQLKTIFETDNKLLPGEEIQFNYIEEIKTYLAFAISSNITNFFVYKFPEIKFFHQGIPLIKNYIRVSKQKSEKPIAALNFRQHFLLDILVVNNGQLLFYNIYNCQGPENTLYIILNALKQFGYDSRIELLGDIDTKHPLYEAMSKYLPDLHFAQVQKDYSIEIDPKVPIHKFANLFYISE